MTEMFETDDYYFARSLMCTGIKLVGIKRQKGGPDIHQFKNTPEVQEAWNDYERTWDLICNAALDDRSIEDIIQEAIEGKGRDKS